MRGASFSVLSLFASGEQGVWYDPSDMTSLFQDSAGTTPVTAVEQPVGLMLDKSKGLALGSELVSNGAFDSGTTGWSSGFGTTTSTFTTNSGVATLTVAGADTGPRYLTSIAGLTTGAFYKVQFSVTGSSGTGDKMIIWTSASDGTGGTVLVQSGTPTVKAYSFILAATATTMRFVIAFNGAVAGSIFSVDNVSATALPGNHASQATSASRPVLSARVNLLTKTEAFDDAAWLKNATTVSANTDVAPDGTTTADTITTTASTSVQVNITTVSGVTYAASASFKKTIGATTFPMLTLNGSASFGQVILNTNTGAASVRSGVTGATNVVVTDQTTYWRLAFNFAPDTTSAQFHLYPAASTNGTSYTTGLSGSCVVWGADLRVSNDGVGLPAYQRVDTATSYDTTGFPMYLAFDGVDDWLATGNINLSATDKVSLWAGMRKLSDVAFSCFAEFSTALYLNNGSFAVLPSLDGTTNSGPYFYVGSKGTVLANAASAATYPAPYSVVQSSILDISGDNLVLRLNGGVAKTVSTDQGTGNFGNYPLYIGRRGDTYCPFNGRLHSLIVRGAASDATQIANAETWVNGKTKAYAA